MMWVVLIVHLRSLLINVPRNLKESVVEMGWPEMCTGGLGLGSFLKSTIISVVFAVSSRRLLLLHQSTMRFIS